jgi:penicillin-binding protein 1C
VCKNDGYLPAAGCETELQLRPADSDFERVSPHNLVFHLDGRRNFRVTSKCELPERMRHVPWFVLPADQEMYFKRHHSDYEALPRYRADCASQDNESPLDLIYPDADTPVYAPIDVAGRKGRTVFEAVHRDPQAQLHWHLDGGYLGKTAVYHQQVLDIAPGRHTITVTDERGNYLSRRFEVVDQNPPAASDRTGPP